MRLREWAEAQGIHYQTAWTWVRDNKMPVPFSRTASGTILVDVPPQVRGGRTVVYARVSSHDQRDDLDRQVARLVAWAIEQGRSVDEVVTEVGSDCSRPVMTEISCGAKLHRMFSSVRILPIFRRLEYR